MTNSQLLRRLMAIDVALASSDGLHLGEMAERLGLSQKTIRRDVQTLANISSVACHQVAADNRAGHSWRHHYADRRRRVFAAWLPADIP